MYQPKLRKQRNGIPIIKNCEIDAHAEEFLRDYNPSLLRSPQPVDIESFAEFYLNLTLDYVYLTHCGLILGRMIFQEIEQVPVYLPKENRADYLYAKRGTLLIDNSLLDDWKEHRLRSTIGHECGHWIFHSDYYTIKTKEILTRKNSCRKLLAVRRMRLKKRQMEMAEKSWLQILTGWSTMPSISVRLF